MAKLFTDNKLETLATQEWVGGSNSGGGGGAAILVDIDYDEQMYTFDHWAKEVDIWGNNTGNEVEVEYMLDVQGMKNIHNLRGNTPVGTFFHLRRLTHEQSLAKIESVKDLSCQKCWICKNERCGVCSACTTRCGTCYPCQALTHGWNWAFGPCQNLQPCDETCKTCGCQTIQGCGKCWSCESGQPANCGNKFYPRCSALKCRTPGRPVTALMSFWDYRRWFPDMLTRNEYGGANAWEFEYDGTKWNPTKPVSVLKGIDEWLLLSFDQYVARTSDTTFTQTDYETGIREWMRASPRNPTTHWVETFPGNTNGTAPIRPTDQIKTTPFKFRGWMFPREHQVTENGDGTYSHTMIPLTPLEVELLPVYAQSPGSMIYGEPLEGVPGMDIEGFWNGTAYTEEWKNFIINWALPNQEE